jgi:hypothetical protein
VSTGLANKNRLLRLLTTIVVSLFLLQSALAGGALGHVGQTPGETCASSQPATDAGGAPSMPGAPAPHHSFCCVLHVSAIVLPQNLSHASLIRLQFPERAFESHTSADATPRLEPSGSPQSPRAPPFSA